MPGAAGKFALRSAGFRFAVVYAVLISASAAALAVFLWWETAGALDRQTEKVISLDVADLNAKWLIGGLQLLVDTIDDRIVQNAEQDAVYLLVDREMNRLAGNLLRWPAEINQRPGWYELQVDRGGAPVFTRVVALTLPGGYQMLVGRDIGVRVKLRDLLTHALGWGVGVVLVLASLGALLVRRLFRRMIANVSLTASAVSRGDLSRRVQLTGRGDEFDQLSEAINDMLDRIVRLMEGVKQVSNAIAHDLRTPIARARARLEEASGHAAGPAELRTAIEQATADLDGIVSVFQALLRIAEIEAGSRRAAFAAIDLTPLLADMAELYEASAEEKGLALNVQLPPSQPEPGVAAPSLPAHGDATLIQQAIANLLDNALKFSPPGTSVTLSGVRAPDGIEITVTDHGPGIPEADRGRAIDRFYRGEAARSTPGSGLGLSLVQAVAQLHGGTLTLEDAHPGLRAVLRLPGNLAASSSVA
jgi:signal transduction histidine kinase